MLIAIVSDTHSRYATVDRVVETLGQQRVELVLHCGDIEDAATVQRFRGLPTHFVFGNCDTERDELRQEMTASGLKLHEPFGDLEVGGSKLAWIHGDDRRLFQDIQRSGQFDYLFYGHTHVAEEHRSGPTLVVNPGALHRARPKSFVLLELPAGKLERITLDS